MPLSWSGRGEGETLKKELRNRILYKAWVSGWPVNHPRLGSWLGLPSAGALGLLAGAVVRIYRGSRTHDLGYKFFSAYMHFPGAVARAFITFQRASSAGLGRGAATVPSEESGLGFGD